MVNNPGIGDLLKTWANQFILRHEEFIGLKKRTCRNKGDITHIPKKITQRYKKSIRTG